MADMMDKTINSIITAFVAVVLIAAAFLPTVIPMINGLTDPQSAYYIAGAGTYATLLGVVITMTVVGIIIGVIKMYTGKSDSGEGER